MTGRSGIEAAIAALEGQRTVRGDAAVDLALAPLLVDLAAIDRRGMAAESQKLKLATVLFIDVVGSTAIGRKLDPEDVHDVMDSALRRFTAVVKAHQGRVMNYTGDGLLAVFGADKANEHDAEYAVRAGLAIIAETQRLAIQPPGSRPHADIKVRGGIDTGQVLLGGGLEGEKNIRGNTVNFAARMEQSAPAGGLRISHNTYRLISGLFDVTEETATRIKGIEDPVHTYLVLGAKPRAVRDAAYGIEGLEARMVGRVAEFSQLRNAFEALFDGRSVQTLTVVADAGLGKSRLLHEFESWMELQPQFHYLFKGRAQSHTRQQPYGLLRDMLARLNQIAESDTAEIARQKLVSGIAPLIGDDGEAAVHLLGHLIGVDFSASPHVTGILGDPQQLRARAFYAAAQMFRHLAASTEVGAPVIVLLEDVHWSDDGTLDFLEYLDRANADVPMLVIVSARPLLFERRPSWIADGKKNTRINLSPLGLEQTRELTDVLLQRLELVPAALRELITRNSDGNPFFMEEIVKMLLDEGVIAPAESGQWHVVAEKLHAAHVPTTLMGVFQVRMDALVAAERVALRQASVIGFVFWDQAIAALDQRSLGALRPLAQRGFVVPQTTSVLATAREFTFQHHLLHQFTYESVLKRERREYHARAAAWLAAFAAERGGEYLGATGEHYERAGANAEAASYYTRAAESAAARDAREAGFDYLDRALALAAPEDHSIQWRLSATREQLLEFGDDRTSQFAELDRLDALADALDDNAKRAEALLRRATAHNNQAEYQKAKSAALRAFELAQIAGATAIAARSYGQLALASRRMGRFEEARLIAEEGLALAGTGGDRSTEAAVMQTLAAILTEQGDPVAGENLIRNALLISRSSGDRRRETELLNSLGDGLVRLGDYEAARGFFIESLRLAEQLGWAQSESIVLLNLANIAHLQGDNESAAVKAQAAARIAVAIGARDLEAAAYLPLGLAELSLGHWDCARAALSRSRDLFELNAGPHLALEPTAGLALLELRLSNAAAAIREAEKIVAHLDNGGTLDGTEEPFRIYLSCYEILRRGGDPRATRLLTEAYARLQERGARIRDDSARHRFLHHVPHHDAIISAREDLASQPNTSS